MQGLLRSPAGAGAGAGGCSSCAQPHSAAEFSSVWRALQALRKQRSLGVLTTQHSYMSPKSGENNENEAHGRAGRRQWHHHQWSVSVCQRELRPSLRRLDRRTLVLTKPGSRHLGRTCTLRGLAHTRARLQEAQRLVCAPPSPAGRPVCGAARALLRRHGLGWPHLHAARDA